MVFWVSVNCDDLLMFILCNVNVVDLIVVVFGKFDYGDDFRMNFKLIEKLLENLSIVFFWKFFHFRKLCSFNF